MPDATPAQAADVQERRMTPIQFVEQVARFTPTGDDDEDNKATLCRLMDQALTILDEAQPAPPLTAQPTPATAPADKYKLRSFIEHQKEHFIKQVKEPLTDKAVALFEASAVINWLISQHRPNTDGVREILIEVRNNSIGAALRAQPAPEVAGAVERWRAANPWASPTMSMRALEEAADALTSMAARLAEVEKERDEAFAKGLSAGATQFAKLHDQIDAAEARNAVLVERLKPFARAAEAFPVSANPRRERNNRETVIWSYQRNYDGSEDRLEITVPHLRDAAAALTPEGT
jgi:hypothetical protein